MNIEMGFGEHSINFTAEFPDFEPLKPEKNMFAWSNSDFSSDFFQ
jgi:hypothetical protein